MATVKSDFVRSQHQRLAERIVELQYARQPEIWKPLGHPGREKSVRDAGYHLIYLAEALEADDPTLFSEYLAWVKILFASLKFPAQVLPTTLDCTRQALEETLPVEARAETLELLQIGIENLEKAPFSLPGYLEGEAPIDQLARNFLDFLLAADRQSASRLILNVVEQGTPVQEIYLGVFQRTQREIGRLWQTNQISVAQEHFCTAATQMVMSQLYPYIFTGERKNRRLVMTCVGGELHEIGARMVADFFEMEGWDTYFLGANTPPESILRTVAERKADILAISVTMTYHIGKVKEIIQGLRAHTAAQTRVLVGGYPFNISTGLWQRIGADGYAPDAQNALREAARLLT
jgi:methylmalonyl-CoA mutase cobalamin-binding domain/chain